VANPQERLTEGEIRSKIALRAYEIYQDRGGQHGRDMDDWLEAESELVGEAEEEAVRYPRKQSSRTQSAHPR
jgi:hypothetical protein